MNVYESVTERLIAALDNGVIPWRKEWQASAGGHIPSNYITKKPYRGVNVFVLMCSEFSSSQWLTYKQAKDAGLQVRKGSKGTQIVFWKFDKKTDKLTGEAERIAFARVYTVFNIEQCDGVPVDLPFDAPKFVPLDEAETIVSGFTMGENAPTLSHGGARACYSPAFDAVQMPMRESFTSPEAYYSTLYHELGHATGHKTRLDRFNNVDSYAFGSESYSKEELIAEFTAAFLCAESGIVNESVLTNHAGYIQGWLRQLKNDKTLAISAAQRAQKAADMILRRSASSETNEAA